MSKSKKLHRQRVVARNQRIKSAAKRNRFQIGSIDGFERFPRLNMFRWTGKMYEKFTNIINDKNKIRKPESMENKEEGKQVNMNGQQPQNSQPTDAQAAPEPVYKFVPEVYAELGAYLLTRPIREVKNLYAAFFRHGQKDPFYKQNAINSLLDYLTQCPMGDVELLLEKLEKGGLQQFIPQIDPKAAADAKGKSEGAPTEQKGEPDQNKPETK